MCVCVRARASVCARVSGFDECVSTEEVFQKVSPPKF